MQRKKTDKNCEPGSTDVWIESERVQALLPVRQVPVLQGLDNASLLSPNRNDISFLVNSNKSILFSVDISTLEKELEQDWKTNIYLQSTEELWRNECESLNRVLETALVCAKGASLPSKETPSSLVSRNKSVPFRSSSKGKHLQQGELCAEVAQNGLPLWLRYNVSMHRKDSANVAQFFFTEVRPISWQYLASLSPRSLIKQMKTAL